MEFYHEVTNALEELVHEIDYLLAIHALFTKYDPVQEF